ARWGGAATWGVALVALVAWRVVWRRGAERFASGLLVVAVAATGAAWHHACWRLFDRDDIGRIASPQPAPICLRAVALDAPRDRAAPAWSPLRAIPQGEKTELLLRVTSVRDRDAWRRAAGRTELLVEGNLLGIHAGDTVQVFGQIRAPGEPLNPGQFDFAADARSRRQLATLRCESPDCVQVVRTGGGVSPWRWISDARVSVERTLARRLGPVRAPIAAAMLIGARQAVPRDRTEAYRRTGTLHVLVVSGLHVGLVVGVFYAGARLGWFPRRPTLLVVMLLILAYTLLVGARPPAVRAAVLAEVMCLAAITGRNILALNSLAAASIIVLALNPGELFRSGPQLSFIAAATLIAFGSWRLGRRPPSPMDRLLASARPWPERLARRVAGSAGLLLFATLVVWLTTAPLLLCRFNLLSPVAVPISLAVFPLVAISVVSGLALLATEVLAPPLAGPFASLCGGSIDLLEAVVTRANATPWGSVWTIGPSAWWTTGAYVLMGGALLAGRTPRTAMRLAQAGAGWLAIGFGAATLNNPPPEGLRCSFIAVGHGCAVLVETPGGGTLLYDAGSLGSPGAATETIAGVLWSKGLRRIDALVLSHADVDHFNAAPGLLERFRVGAVYTSSTMFGTPTDGVGEPIQGRPSRRWSAPEELRQVIQRAGVPHAVLRRGDRLRIADVTVDVLHPLEGDVGSSDNSRSLVLSIEHRGRRLLLPGDLEAPGMDDLMLRPPHDCDVLLAPHHGSARSDPPGFAAWSTPEWVVISGGASDAYSASAGRSYAASGANVLRTTQAGMIAFEFSERRIEPTAFLTGELSRPRPAIPAGNR
ncbi:MAG: ComEC/Rec2 family competence protein, partial [Planctomycetota bacterium]